MINPPDFAAIATLDLGRIITKLCHVESGEGWSSARADAATLEYRRFLYLMKTFPAEQTVPSVEVDTFWHYHILDTMQYAADCATVFGYFLHHDPAVGLDDASDAPERLRRAERMDSLYAATFGNAPASRVAGTYCGAAVTVAAWCGAAVDKAAWCGRTGVGDISDGGAAVAKAAWCGRTGVGDVSYCGRTGVGDISDGGASAAASAAIA
ncbi:MAG: glycine-rich domain-containing protein-like [Pseudomonadota bacterium]|nr:glycine-rich domain-containing protein-like [Pseudomonadota bacterium]